MTSIFALAAELEERNHTFALITIVSAVGSTPRSKAHMIVTESGDIHGTIGGGLAESFIIEEARERMKTDSSGMVSYRLDQDGSAHSIDMLCGGDLDVYIEIFSAATHLILIGGGHVNLEIARVAHQVGFSITVVETRAEFATSERFPMARDLIVHDSVEQALAQLTITANCALLIATHSHDQKPLELLLSSDFGYLGMLGSRRKVAFIKDELKALGHSPALLKHIHAPAGLDLGAETPQQIAVSIVSEIMSVMNTTSGIPLSQRAGNLLIVRGAGDIATGTILRLHQCGYRILALETSRPSVIRRTVSFAQAVYDGTMIVEGVTAEYTDSYSKAKTLMDHGIVAVMADPTGESIRHFSPFAVIDAILAKKNLGTEIDMAPCVIGLGPGFTAGVDVDAVIETNRGHDLGRVIWSGRPADDTGVPGIIAGMGKERVLRSPCAGVFTTDHEIGDLVKQGEPVAYIDETQVPATIDGVIRGLLVSGMEVTQGFKVGDIDPRGDISYCMRVSDKARAVAGGVLEALISSSMGVHRPGENS
ncbi:MAG: EF2563 family selenium-dependent molybdenum hydroxylase system protein [Spirochaetia bacterium]|nr:EF2563 family selenium-dependent molybdenum hydroxylase system protein [Spirochaetia bacterium]MCF7940983.1 EF2563 family selenium-dependent molybdenum hydroxylase system protein [Spirochaetia bacterium]